MRRPWAAVAVALLLALAPDAAAAVGPCEATARATPKRAGTGLFRPPLFIGDSSMLLGVPAMARLGFRADARGCRSAAAAVDLVAAHRRRHRVRLAVLAVGANGGVTFALLRRARRMSDVLGLVAGAGSPVGPRVMRRFARRHRQDTVLIDWRSHNPYRHVADGIHIGTAGEEAEARFIHRHVRQYMPPSRRLARTVPRRVPPGDGCGSGIHVVAGRLDCRQAQRVARRPGAAWRVHDWQVAGRPPWAQVLERRRPRVVLAIR